jgi:hypothetical protein
VNVVLLPSSNWTKDLEAVRERVKLQKIVEILFQNYIVDHFSAVITNNKLHGFDMLIQEVA